MVTILKQLMPILSKKMIYIANMLFGFLLLKQQILVETTILS